MPRIFRCTLLAAPLLALAPATIALADDAPETPTANSQGNTPGEVVDDSAITAKVKSQLIADPATKARHIEVATRQGVVSLKGKVDSADERVRAVDIARKTRGVHSVDDELRVAR